MCVYIYTKSILILITSASKDTLYSDIKIYLFDIRWHFLTIYIYTHIDRQLIYLPSLATISTALVYISKFHY